MTAATEASRRRFSPGSWRNLMRDRPLVPLTGLLMILVVAVELGQPGTVRPTWAGVVVRAAIPLAILAGCQTLTMLTGGIDLSVGYVASMVGFVTATLVEPLGGVPLAILVALTVAAMAGIISGVGVGVFRVHPLIMTLGMGLIVFGFSNTWQLQTLQTGSGIPDAIRTVGVGIVGDVLPFGLGDMLPYSLVVFVPLAALILIGLRRTGYGRLLFAIGDNPIAARLSGARSTQVLIVLYVISAVLAGIAGLLYAGLGNAASVTLVQSQMLPSVAAAVIGGTSILGGRGTYSGTMLGALILTVLTALLTILGLPEPWRQIVFGSIIVAVAAAYTRVTAEA